MDWVESGIEFFGCEGEAGRSVIGQALMLQHNFIQQLPPEAITEARDYVKLHEEFFKSLLKEQVLSLADPAAPPGLTQSESQGLAPFPSGGLFGSSPAPTFRAPAPTSGGFGGFGVPAPFGAPPPAAIGTPSSGAFGAPAPAPFGAPAPRSSNKFVLPYSS